MADEALRKYIGKHLQASRKAGGYKSAKAFALRMGLAPTAYTEYEQGRHMFTIEQAWEFAEALGIDIDALVGFEAERVFSDPGQAALNAYFESMNSAGRGALVESARLMSGSPDTRIEKDRAEPHGVPAEVGRSA